MMIQEDFIKWIAKVLMSKERSFLGEMYAGVERGEGPHDVTGLELEVKCYGLGFLG